jgi:D-sedoheptulose 7-phosphate isomerase
MNWISTVEDLGRILAGLAFTDESGEEAGVDDAFARWQAWTGTVRDEGGSVFFVGNGASATMASHFAADLAKNARIRTEVFTDPALLTAYANDWEYASAFAESIQLRARAGDMLIAISSSGKSPNILRAAAAARAQGLQIMTLTGMAPDNDLRAHGDLNAYVAGTTYGDVETAHAAVLHHWIDGVTS